MTAERSAPSVCLRLPDSNSVSLAGPRDPLALPTLLEAYQDGDEAASFDEDADEDNVDVVMVVSDGQVLARRRLRRRSLAGGGGGRMYECEHCRKVCASASKLLVHTRTHTGERPFSCTTCGRAFSDRSSFTRHERTHTGARPYECPVCHFAFTDSSALSKHRKRVHHCA